jgi:hypothetical protein
VKIHPTSLVGYQSLYKTGEIGIGNFNNEHTIWQENDMKRVEAWIVLLLALKNVSNREKSLFKM